MRCRPSAAFTLVLLACTDPAVRGPGDDTEETDTDTDTSDTAVQGPCPIEMVLVGAACMDRYEAPNLQGEPPLVMYTFLEAEDWCEARGKRLCFDDEWQQACEGAAGTPYPYGDAHQPGVCNDEEPWITYSATSLGKWPYGVAYSSYGTLSELYAGVAAEGAGPAEAVAHVQDLYQGELPGENPGCVNEWGVYDLTGNVEEWTRRRDGGTTDFHGKLKGRYWAETRTCQNGVTTHGDAFRFYEIGFRCCQDPR